MRDPNNPQLITFQNWTMRVRPSEVKEPRLLLLVHGLTGDENSMWIFARNFPEDYWIISPRAPYKAEHSGGGYSWKPDQPGTPVTENESPGTITLEDLRPAALSLISLVDSYAEDINIRSTQFDVLGFSQGAALTNTLAMLHPERIRRAGILAGFIPENAGMTSKAMPLIGKPFFVAHGRLDEKVNIEYARQTVETLKALGADVTFCEDEVGHRLSAHCLRALESFFTTRIPR